MNFKSHRKENTAKIFFGCEEHRKQDLYKALAEEDWNEVYQSLGVDQAASRMERIILSHLEKWMPDENGDYVVT